MKLSKFIILMALVLIYACGGGGGGSDYPSASRGNSVTPGSGETAPVVTAPATITLTATPTNITVGGSSSVRATVLDSQGANVPDGTTVSFSITPSSYGSITSQMSTVDGIATATFTASNTAGQVTITAASGSATKTVVITITGADSGSIAFLSATPSNIGIKKTSQTEISTIKFSVRDINGTAVANGTGIDFCITGPNGGEYVNDLDIVTEAYNDVNDNDCYDTGETYTDSDGNGRYTSPSHAAVSTLNGEATATLHSGSAPGNVTIFARVAGKDLSSASPVISIGGGMPSEKHLTIATTKFNLEGFAYTDIQATISTYVADRVGNANVLQGTTVSYFTEAGATLTSSSTLNNQGATSVIFRTQNPMPANVAPLAWENTLCSDIEAEYDVDVYDGVPPDGETFECKYGHPRDGWAAVTAMMTGEEAFNDANGNGIYDGADTYDDTPQEAFINKNDSNARDAANPFEEYKDDDGDGIYDGFALVPIWDSNKTIFANINLLFTDEPYYVKLSRYNAPNWVPASGAFAVANGTSVSFQLLVADKNLNPLISGTTVSIKSDAGKQAGITSYTFPDFVPSESGPVELPFSIASTDTGNTKAAEVCTITVEVTWKGIKYTSLFTGTVD